MYQGVRSPNTHQLNPTDVASAPDYWPSFGRRRNSLRVQPVEREIRFWAVPVRGVGGRDAAVKPTGRY
jgi:hypothetical protein